MPPLIAGSPAQAGLLEVELEPSDSARILDKRYPPFRRDLLLILTLFMGTLGGLGLLVMRQRIVTRLAEMARVAHAVAQGDLQIRVKEMGHDEISELAGALNRMADSLQETIVDLKRTELLAMAKLAELAETRDPDTGAHLQRIPLYCKALAEALCKSPNGQQLDDAYIRDLVDSSPLHDIGKVGIPDSILRKPGPLTAQEFEIMQRHVLIGADVLSGAHFLSMARDMALYHHERYDGTGYPYGLSGKDIPLPARILALADMYDALTSRRVYKEAYTHAEASAIIQQAVSHEQASEILARASGSRFDPDVMQAFQSSAPEFQRIRQRFSG